MNELINIENEILEVEKRIENIEDEIRLKEGMANHLRCRLKALIYDRLVCLKDMDKKYDEID